MNYFLLDNIPLEIQSDQLYAFLNIKPKSRFAGEFDGLLAEAAGIARPKAIYKLSTVEENEGDSVQIDGMRVDSRVVKINLNDRGRAFPFIATCGSEIETWADGLEGRIQRFWADAIQLFALAQAIDAMKHDIQDRFETGSTSTMNPGSLEDWPIQGLQTIFSVIGNAHEQTGVRLNDSLMMKPLKSASGLEFESEEQFYNCQLCPRSECSMRRAPYNDHLYQSKYRGHEK
jgi:hypothetical protein